MPGYRLTPHTADVGLVAWGGDLVEAFQAAVQALVAVTFDPRTIAARDERTVAVEADRPDRLLVRFLNEIVYLVDAEGFVPRRAGVTIDGARLEAHLVGRVADSSGPRRRGPAVKAVTYHGLDIDPGPPVRVRVVLDI